MEAQVLAQWPLLVLVLVIGGPLLKVIQTLYERLYTEAVAIRDRRIAEQKDQLLALASSFGRLADALEPYIDPAQAPQLRRRQGGDG